MTGINKEVLGQKNLELGIEQLDYSITVKDGKYKDHYKTILNWNKRGFLKDSGERANKHEGIKAWLDEKKSEVDNASIGL